MTPFRARDNVRKGDRADESSAALTSFSPGEDIDAVRPTYQQRFKSFAERMPALKSVQWSCTEVVVWTWTIERRPDQYGHDRVICQDEPFIPYGKTITGPKVEGGGIYMTAPRGM